MVTNHKAKTHSGFTKGEEKKIRAYYQEKYQFTKEQSNRVKNKSKKERRDLQNIQETIRWQE